MRIDITRTEAEALRDFLRQKIRELDIEISRTDAIAFKKDLQQSEHALERVLAEVGTAMTASPSA